MEPLMKDEAIAAQALDYKTALQEICQKKHKAAPVYTLLAESGPDHEKIFEMEVVIGENIRQIGRGKSKKKRKSRRRKSLGKSAS